MKPKLGSGIKPNCRYCKHAGPVVNFICFCSAQGIKRSTGIRYCDLFVADIGKYNSANNSNKV